jgi:hypothetical protein
MDEVLVITDTQPRFSDQQLKDMAQSQDLKGSEAAALAEQKKASEIMAERLPGLTDPNAPPPQQPQPKPGADGLPAPPAAAIVPKLVQPAHPDRFTPGNATSPNGGGGTGQAAPKPKKPAVPRPDAEQNPGAPGENPPAPKPAQPKPANPQPQRER